MFVASKFVQYNGLRLRTVVAEVGCHQFTPSELKKKEIEMLRIIDFGPDLPTSYEIIESLFADFLCSHEELKGSEELKKLEKLRNSCVYLAVLCCHDYSLLKFK